jgi:hypothetical protein
MKAGFYVQKRGAWLKAVGNIFDPLSIFDKCDKRDSTAYPYNRR